MLLEIAVIHNIFAILLKVRSVLSTKKLMDLATITPSLINVKFLTILIIAKWTQHFHHLLKVIMHTKQQIPVNVLMIQI